MTPELWIGGADARAAFGLVVSRVTGLHDAPEATLAPVVVPGRAGALLLQEPQVGARVLGITGTIRGATPAAARSARDRLLTILRRRGLVLRTADDATRELACEVTRVVATPVGAQFIARTIPIEIGATALDPYWTDVAPTVIADIGRTPVPCPLGSAPVRPVLTIANPGAVVRIELRDALGAVVTRCELAGLIPGVPVVIDCAAQTIRQGEVSQLRALLAGDFPVLDPTTQADVLAGAWPTLSVSNGTMVATYRRAWA